MKSMIYVLHFDEAICHARHYSGMTKNLMSRLERHATGNGSRLCRELHDRGITWRLGGLYQCSDNVARKLERQLKNNHQASRFCGICNRITQKIPGATNYPISELFAFPTDSESILTRMKPSNEIVSVAFTSAFSDEKVHADVKRLANSEREALGFIPAGGPEGMTYLIDRGQVAIARIGNEAVGYAAFTRNLEKRTLRFQQVVVSDAFRLCGIGQRMVESVLAQEDELTAIAHVRDDLPANLFWEAIGFLPTGSFIHKTSRNKLNVYTMEDRSNAVPL